ncbi:hypothetical protein MAR_001219, partial [Mya arenaria]
MKGLVLRHLGNATRCRIIDKSCTFSLDVSGLLPLLYNVLREKFKATVGRTDLFTRVLFTDCGISKIVVSLLTPAFVCKVFIKERLRRLYKPYEEGQTCEQR